MLYDDRMLNIARLMDASDLRAKVHAENLANLSTPGFRAKAVAFESQFADTLARQGDVAARQVQPEIYEPRATALGNDGNDVDLDREVTLSSENSLLYNSYVSILRGKHRLLNTAINGGGGA